MKGHNSFRTLVWSATTVFTLSFASGVGHQVADVIVALVVRWLRDE